MIGWPGTAIDPRFNLALLADVLKELRADLCAAGHDYKLYPECLNAIDFVQVAAYTGNVLHV